MAEQNVTAGLDHKAIADGLGELKEGPGYSRVLGPGGNGTIAYLKKDTVTVKAAALAGAPKKAKLPEFTVEKNGQWAGAKVDTATARRVLEYVVVVAERAARELREAR
jgi:hypothetical protein